MCGFIGFINDNKFERSDEKHNELEYMNDLITHRGPDDSGYYTDDYVRFGFRRLSIIDLEAGHQPLSYESERYWIIFNGEIYNYLELKKDLLNKEMEFKTDSDTEVILAMFQQYGVEAISKLRGMFAFVIWDKETQQLTGARDQFGIKPFFYMENNDITYFASEKKSILHALKNELLDFQSLYNYMTFQYVPEPNTMSDGIYKLSPGHYFTKKAGEPLQIEKYWQASFNPVHKSEDDYKKEIRDVLFDSVKAHMIADVPLGSFLSGGIDSSAIVAIAKEFDPNIKTFSVGFERDGFSEVDVAKETADALNLDNYHYMITPEEYMNELPKIIWHMDDPLADPAAIPLYFVAREARKQVKVVLSGEGADELFGGYNIYREPDSLKHFNAIPKAGKGILKSFAQMLPEGTRGKSFIMRGCTPLEERYIGNARMFTEEEKQKLFKSAINVKGFIDVITPFYSKITDYNPVNKMQYIDIHTWLTGDILLKADKMTMANSLELRVPFLDKEVFKVASQIPVSYKIANGTTKSILRKAVADIVPDHVINRKKLGFPVPIRHWLKNEMYDWAKNIIKSSPTTDYFFNEDYILQLLEDHCKDKADNSRKLWTILIFMIWHRIFLEENQSFCCYSDKTKETQPN